MSMINTDASLNTIYNGMVSAISNMPSKILFAQADTYTGKSDSEIVVRKALAENSEKKETLDEATSDIQTNRSDLKTINEKVERIKQLAEDAASGNFSSEYTADAQVEIEALILAIDDLAHGNPGETHFLIDDSPNATYDLGNGSTITVDTADMTSAGLGLDSIDVTADAEGAIAAAIAALGEIDDHDDYLVVKAGVVESTSLALDVQSTVLMAAESMLESVDSAMSMMSLILASMSDDADSFVVAQANALTDTAINLLSEDQ
ncbi:MAG TPA: hypothetical protein ENH94_11560 [Phycisphaerales bacterium]|nr:hypothetical protein [Phycisphaerales bacterium]